MLGVSRQRVHILCRDGSLEHTVQSRHLYVSRAAVVRRQAELASETSMITVPVAARLLGVDARRIYKWVERGRLPARRTKQRRLLFNPADIAAFTPPATGRPRKDHP